MRHIYVCVRGRDQLGGLQHQIKGASSSGELQKWKMAMGVGVGKRPGPHQHVVWASAPPPAAVSLNEKAQGISNRDTCSRCPEPWLKEMLAS